MRSLVVALIGKSVATAVSLLLLSADVAWTQSYGIVGAEQYFSVEWEVGHGKSGTVVAGHVRNTYGLAARNVRLHIEGLDGSGKVVSVTVGYVAGTLMPGVRAYFEVPVPPGAATYRVNVLSFDWLCG